MKKKQHYVITYDSVKSAIARTMITIEAEDLEKAQEKALELRASIKFKDSDYKNHIKATTGIVDIYYKK